LPTKRGSAGRTGCGRAGRRKASAAGSLQFIGEFVYLYGAVSPKDGTCVDLIMPGAQHGKLADFLGNMAKK
jgi:hypothetical protein